MTINSLNIARWTTILVFSIILQNVSCTAMLDLDDEESSTNNNTTNLSTKIPYYEYDDRSRNGTIDEIVSDVLPSSPPIGDQLVSEGEFNDNADVDYELQFLMEFDRMQKELYQRRKNETAIVDVNSSEETTLVHNEIIIENNKAVARTTTPTEFIELCVPYFQTHDVRKDDLITNDEAAEFFEYLCDEINNPSCKNTDIPFYSLDTSIQRLFIRLICPRLSDGSADQACLDELKQNLADENQISVEITTENEAEVNRNMELYCEDIYPLSTEYHFGTLSPSPYEPSSIPSEHPTPNPSLKPSLRPSLKPSLRPTEFRPTEPTKSPKPTTSPYPSYQPSQSKRPSLRPSSNPTTSPSTPQPTSSPSTPQPTTKNRYTRSFTYKMGVEGSNVLRGIVGNGRNDIMDSISNAIESELIDLSPYIVSEASSSSLSSCCNHNRKTLTISESSGVRHVSITETSCDDEFDESAGCVIIVSEITLESSTKFTEEEVDDYVYPFLRQSMLDGSFRSEINRNEVKGIAYVTNGDEVPLDDSGVFPPPESGLGGLVTASITLSAFLFVMFVACFAGRARGRRSDDLVIERDFTNVENEDYDDDHDLYLDEEYFLNEDMEFTAAYQSKMQSEMMNTTKEPSGVDQPIKDDQGNTNTDESLPEDSFNDFPAVLSTTRESKDNTDNDIVSYFDGEHFDDNDMSQERMKNSIFDTNEENKHKDAFEENPETNSPSPFITSTKEGEGLLVLQDSESSPDESEQNTQTTLIKSIERENEKASELNNVILSGENSKNATFTGDDLSQDDDISVLSSLYSRSGLSFDPSITRSKISNAMEDGKMESTESFI